MASSKTGQLNQNFLANTNTIPNSNTYAEGRGTDEPKKVGNRKQRTFNRTPKGAVTHNVSTPGTPRNIRPDSPNTL